jgi:hypothetical protein
VPLEVFAANDLGVDAGANFVLSHGFSNELDCGRSGSG